MDELDYPAIPLPVTFAYAIEGVSVATPQPVVDEQRRPIVRSSKHQVYRFSLVVQGTNRAAMSEYLLVMRPSEGTPPNTAYEYLQQTTIVRNQDGKIDINTPVLYFEPSNDQLMVHFSSFVEDPALIQTVLVYVTKIYRT